MQQHDRRSRAEHAIVQLRAVGQGDEAASHRGSRAGHRSSSLVAERGPGDAVPGPVPARCEAGEAGEAPSSAVAVEDAPQLDLAEAVVRPTAAAHRHLELVRGRPVAGKSRRSSRLAARDARRPAGRPASAPSGRQVRRSAAKPGFLRRSPANANSVPSAGRRRSGSGRSTASGSRPAGSASPRAARGGPARTGRDGEAVGDCRPRRCAPAGPAAPSLPAPSDPPRPPRRAARRAATGPGSGSRHRSGSSRRSGQPLPRPRGTGSQPRQASPGGPEPRRLPDQQHVAQQGAGEALQPRPDARQRACRQARGGYVAGRYGTSPAGRFRGGRVRGRHVAIMARRGFRSACRRCRLTDPRPVPRIRDLC